MGEIVTVLNRIILYRQSKQLIVNESFQNLMCVEKNNKISLIKAENEVNNGIMDKFSNEEQGNFRLFNMCKRFLKGL